MRGDSKTKNEKIARDIESTIRKSLLEIPRARTKFGLKYCRERGWPTNIGELSFEQILEIREQAG